MDELDKELAWRVRNEAEDVAWVLYGERLQEINKERDHAVYLAEQTRIQTIKAADKAYDKVLKVSPAHKISSGETEQKPMPITDDTNNIVSRKYDPPFAVGGYEKTFDQNVYGEG